MRGRAGICLAAAMVLGCGGGPRAPRPAPADGDPGFPQQVPWAAPGERAVYRISVHDLEIAAFTVETGEVGELDGRPVVVVRAGVQSVGLASWFRRVDDNFTSWIDAETSRTVLFRAVELADPKSDSDEVESIDAEAGRIVDGAFRVLVHRPGEDELVERQVVSDLPLFDFNSFNVALRSWMPPVGTTATADVIRSRYTWRTDATMRGAELTRTDLGELPAVRIDGISRRLRRDGSIDDAIPARHYQLWISDDADRVPLRVVARTDYGDVRMDIVEYTPGAARIGP